MLEMENLTLQLVAESLEVLLVLGGHRHIADFSESTWIKLTEGS